MEIGRVGASGYNPYAQLRQAGQGASGRGGAAGEGQGGASGPGQLTPEEQQQVQKLKSIDQKVRAHEQAHLAAAAGLGVGGANFQFVRGPDGKQYAVAGEVKIDTSGGQTPEQTIAKAQRIQAAALAPADPSGQDRAVAAAATQMEAQARIEKSKQDKTEATGGDSQASTAANNVDPAAAPAGPGKSGEAAGQGVSPPSGETPGAGRREEGRAYTLPRQAQQAIAAYTAAAAAQSAISLFA